MAIISDVAFIPATLSGMVYRMKELLKTAGWTVPSSSDGTTYNAGGDQITHGASGAGGMDNSRAWFRLRFPGGTREFLFQRNSSTGANTANLWRIRYSKSDGFTGGSPSATVTPSATDGQAVMGAGTDASPTFGVWSSNNDGTIRCHLIADNAAPYGWHLVSNVTGTTTVGTVVFCFEPLSGTSPTDPDPYLIYHNNNYGGSGAGLYSYYIGQGSGGMALEATGQYQGSWIGSSFSSYVPACVIGSVITIGPPPTVGVVTVREFTGQGLPVNPYSGKDELVPLIYARRSGMSAPTGWKGIGTLILSGLSATSRTNWSTFTVASSKDKILINYGALPWNGTDPIL